MISSKGRRKGGVGEALAIHFIWLNNPGNNLLIEDIEDASFPDSDFCQATRLDFGSSRAFQVARVDFFVALGLFCTGVYIFSKDMKAASRDSMTWCDDEDLLSRACRNQGFSNFQL